MGMAMTLWLGNNCPHARTVLLLRGLLNIGSMIILPLTNEPMHELVRCLFLICGRMLGTRLIFVVLLVATQTGLGRRSPMILSPWLWVLALSRRTRSVLPSTLYRGLAWLLAYASTIIFGVVNWVKPLMRLLALLRQILCGS